MLLAAFGGRLAAGLAYEENFNAGDGGYTVSGPNASWAWGTVTSGPGAAHSGLSAWATNLAGDYANSADAYLSSPEINLSAHSGQALFLSWWHVLLTEAQYDFASVEVSKNGGATWQVVYGEESGTVDSAWTRHTVQLDPSFAVHNLRLRFRLRSDDGGTAAGFYIDDISILPATLEPVYTQDFDTDSGDYEAEGVTSWAWGMPGNGPGAAHSLPNVWGTGLSGLYGPSESGVLVSPAIDASAHPDRALVLGWWQYLVSEAVHDQARVDVSSDNGTTWETVYGPVSGEVSSTWTRQSVVLDAAHAVSGLRVRFGLVTDSSIGNVGFYIDDIELSAAVAGRPAVTDIERRLTEDTSLTFSLQDFSAAFSSAGDETPVTVRVTSLPEHGTLQREGRAVSAGEELEASSVDQLVYTPTADFDGSDTFGWNAGNGLLYAAAAASCTLTVAPVNDAPVIEVNTLTVDEGQTVTVTGQTLHASDVDNTAAELGYTVTSVANGHYALTVNGTVVTTFTQAQVDNGEIQFVHDGGNQAPAAQLTVSDGELSDSGNATVFFSDQNDAPVLTANSLTVDQGQTVVLTSSELAATDEEDDDNTLTFTVSSVTQGQFEMLQAPGVAVTSFTREQLGAGRIRFVHDDSRIAPSYDVTVADSGGLSAGPHAASVSFTSINQMPEVTAFSVRDAQETTAGYTDQPELAVSLAATDADGTIVGWMVTGSNVPPQAADPGWSASPPTAYTLTGPEGLAQVYAWVKDSDGGVNPLAAASTASIVFERPLTFTLSAAGASPTELRFGHWGGATPEADANLDVVLSAPEQDGGPTVYLASLEPGASDRLQADYRATAALTRWRLVVDVGDSGAVGLSWDVSAAAPSRALYLQPLRREQASGAPVDMSAISELAVTESTVFEVVYGTTAVSQIEVRGPWDLVGHALLTGDTLQQAFADQGRDAEGVGPFWGWDGETYFPVPADRPLSPETGYWARTTHEVVNGGVNGLAADGTIELTPGWNLISPVSAFDTAQAGAIIAAVWAWDPFSRMYVAPVDGILRPGRGYWVYNAHPETVLLNTNSNGSRSERAP